MEKSVVLYVCPSADCGNYFGSPSMGNLDERMSGGKGLNFEPMPANEHPMSDCPDCRDRGVPGRRRVRVELKVKVPEPATA